MTTALAAFDFDGTLSRGDCLVPFLRQVAGTRSVAAAFRRHARAAARRDRDGVKQGVLADLLGGRDAEALDQAGEAYAALVVERRLRSDVVDRLRWHQGLGHRTVIVSASLRPYLEPVRRRLGVDHLICTELEVVDGCVTGRIRDANCRGQVKADRLLAWLGSMPDEMWAYGDSSGDTELLALAMYPERVRRLRPIPLAGVTG